MQHVAEVNPNEKALFSRLSVTFLKYSKVKATYYHTLCCTSFVFNKKYMLQGLFTFNKKKISI